MLTDMHLNACQVGWKFSMYLYMYSRNVYVVNYDIQLANEWAGTYMPIVNSFCF